MSDNIDQGQAPMYQHNWKLNYFVVSDNIDQGQAPMFQHNWKLKLSYLSYRRSMSRLSEQMRGSDLYTLDLTILHKDKYQLYYIHILSHITHTLQIGHQHITNMLQVVIAMKK